MVQEGGSSSVSSSPLQLFSMMSLSPGLGSLFTLFKEISSEERGLCLISLLLNCASDVAAGNVEKANIGLDHISRIASPDGDVMQRIVAYFTEALADRLLKGWPGLHRALNSTKITSVTEEIILQKLFFDLCPFLKLAYVITNQAILEAMEGEKVVHIIDLHCFEPAQWITLIQALRARDEGPPHLKITGIHECEEVLRQMAHTLNREAERLDIAFQFNPVVSRLEDLDTESLRVKTGEALAISSVLQLHPLLATDDQMLWRNSPASSNGSSTVQIQRGLQISPRTLGDFLENDFSNAYGFSPDSASCSPVPLVTPPKMARILSALWAFSPKLMVVTEQESNHNGHSLMQRIREAFVYYAHLFDCLESTVPKASVERHKIEKMIFGQEIKNIVACEGLERMKRHEKLERWIPRLEVAGFGKVSLSFNGMMQANKLLRSNNNYDGCAVREKNGLFFICWHDQPLFSVSAWRFRRHS